MRTRSTESVTRAPSTARSSRWSKSFVALGAALHLALLPATAGAVGAPPGNATPVQREQAQSKFARGKELFGQKKYDEALVEFRNSHDIVASPNARLYLARCLREKGRLVEAYVEFGRTEVEAKELAAQDSRYEKTGEAASAERKELEPKLGFVTITIERTNESTKMTIAGEEVRRAGWGEPFPLVPGTNEIVVETPGKPPQKKSVTIAAGEKTTVTLDAGVEGGVTIGPGAKAPDVAPPTAPVAPPKADTGPDRSHLRPYAYVAGGVGVAGLLTFTVFGLMANSRYSTLKKECGGPCPELRRGDIEGGQTQQTIANIGLVVGVIGAAAGVTLFVLSGKKGSSTEVVVGPSYVGFQGAF